ncbi:MAG: pilus assembly protein PilM [Vulcanimicrobiota bacterium]
MFAKKIHIGLDIGHYSVKAAVTGPNKRDIIDLAEAEITPERTLLDEKSTDEQVTEAIRRVCAQYTDKGSKFNPTLVCALQGEGAVCKYLEIPKLDRSKQELAIQSAVIKNISFPLEEAFMTHFPVPTLSNKDNAGIFFFAIRKSSTARLQELISTLNIKIDRFEPPATSLIKGFNLNHDNAADQCTAIVHVGSSHTLIIILRNGSPYYVREFATAGRDFTYAFQMGAQSTWKRAEEYKYAYDATKKEIPIEPVLTRWVDQIKKTLSAFTRLEKSAAVAVDGVYLTGGSSNMKGLDRRLSEVLNLPVTVETWGKIKAGGDLGRRPCGAFTVALGMIL